MFIEFVKKLDLPNRYTHTYMHTQFGGLCRSLAGKVRSCPFILACRSLGVGWCVCRPACVYLWTVHFSKLDCEQSLNRRSALFMSWNRSTCVYVCSSDKMDSFLVDFMQESRLNSCYTWCIVENFAWEHFVQFTDRLWLTKIFTAKVIDCQATWFTVNLSTRFTVHGSTSVVLHSC